MTGGKEPLMIPPFGVDGNLPPGIHRCTDDDFHSRFSGGTSRRTWLGDRFREILEIARSTNSLQRVFVWGSFVTAKEDPNDLDILLILSEDFNLAKIGNEARLLFEHGQARIRFNADIFWAKESIGEQVLSLWLDTYQMTRDFKHRGIIEVIKA